MASPTTWLITGASRGLGLKLVELILESANTDNIVLATCRNPSNAPQLQALAQESTKAKRLYIIKLDVSDESVIDAAATEVSEILDREGLSLNYLINNAGASFDRDEVLTIKPKPFLDTVTTNVLGPIIVAQKFASLLDKAKKPVVCNISSSLGSIGLDCGTLVASYSASKSALNMITYKLAREKTNWIVFVLDPGWVKTDMGGPTADLEVDFSVSNMLKVITSITPADSASFKRYDGEAVPW